jgi:hypothetical protein
VIVLTKIEELTRQVLECRTFGHRWHEEHADLQEHGIRHVEGLRMMMRCDRCTMGREDTVSQTTGAVLARRYIQPQQWQKVPGVGHGRIDFRLELLKRRGNFKPLGASK